MLFWKVSHGPRRDRPRKEVLVYLMRSRAILVYSVDCHETKRGHRVAVRHAAATVSAMGSLSY